MFAYAPTRAEYTLQYLLRHRAALNAPLFAKRDIEVVSFGGGPASELVGLIRYLESPESGESVNAVHYSVYDKDGEWEDVARDVVSSIQTEIEIDVNYLTVDASSRREMANIDLSKADLVMFSYFMSELAKLESRDRISENFRGTLSGMKVGSKILFIDNKHKIFTDFFRSCKLVRGLIEKSDNGDPVDCRFPAYSGVFDSLAKSLDWQPRTNLSSVSKLIVRTVK